MALRHAPAETGDAKVGLRQCDCAHSVHRGQTRRSNDDGLSDEQRSKLDENHAYWFLQLTAKHNVAPVNWKPGDDVIVDVGLRGAG
jgi:hypothetical protein